MLVPRRADGSLAFQQGQLAVVLAVLALSAVFAVAARGRPGAYVAGLTLLCGAELLYQWSVLNRLYARELLFPEPPLVGFLHAQPGTFRVAGIAGTLFPSTNVFARLEDIRTHDAVERRDYLAFLDATCGYPYDYFKMLRNLDASALDFLNVRFVLGGPRDAAPGPRWRPVYAGADGTAFENSTVLPRAFAPSRIRFVAPPPVRPWPVLDAAAAFGRAFPEITALADWHATAYVLADGGGRRDPQPARSRCRSTPSRPTPPPFAHGFPKAGRTGGSSSRSCRTAAGGPATRRVRPSRRAWRTGPSWRSGSRRATGGSSCVTVLPECRSVARSRSRRSFSSPRPPSASGAADGCAVSHPGSPFWVPSGALQGHVNRSASGHPSVDWLSHVRTRNLPAELPRVLVVGCGEGFIERSLARMAGVGAITAVDADPATLERARRGAARRGLAAVTHAVLDPNAAPLPDGPWDAVIVHDTLHHVARLEEFYERLHDILAVRGRVVFVEYVGPNRFQYPAERAELVQRYFRLLPRRLRTDERTGTPGLAPRADRRGGPRARQPVRGGAQRAAASPRPEGLRGRGRVLRGGRIAPSPPHGSGAGLRPLARRGRAPARRSSAAPRRASNPRAASRTTSPSSSAAAGARDRK